MKEELPRQAHPSLKSSDLEVMARPQPGIDDQHRREAVSPVVFREGRPQGHFVERFTTTGSTGSAGSNSMSTEMIKITTPDSTPTLSLGYNNRCTVNTCIFEKNKPYTLKTNHGCWGSIVICGNMEWFLRSATIVLRFELWWSIPKLHHRWNDAKLGK